VALAVLEKVRREGIPVRNICCFVMFLVAEPFCAEALFSRTRKEKET
jgi:hypothetical protein